ncbi:MAG: DNA-binding protein HU [Syntrophomonadaceae bacterium]|nr:DNA-binding protein HU [Bacillota bacterium]
MNIYTKDAKHPSQPSPTPSQTSLTKSGEPVRLSGFGTFDARYVAAHQARSPKTGEPVQVPVTNYPTFRADKTLKGNANTGTMQPTGKLNYNKPSTWRYTERLVTVTTYRQTYPDSLSHQTAGLTITLMGETGILLQLSILQIRCKHANPATWRAAGHTTPIITIADS